MKELEVRLARSKAKWKIVIGHHPIKSQLQVTDLSLRYIADFRLRSGPACAVASVSYSSLTGSWRSSCSPDGVSCVPERAHCLTGVPRGGHGAGAPDGGAWRASILLRPRAQSAVPAQARGEHTLCCVRGWLPGWAIWECHRDRSPPVPSRLR